MKEKYVGTLENMWGHKALLYTYADSIEKAKKNLEYQKSQKEELGMFRFKKVEKELKEDTREENTLFNKEEIPMAEEKKDEKEVIKRIDFLDSRYYVSNMGRVFSDRGATGELTELNTNIAGSGKNCITIVKKDGKQTTYSIDSIVWRTFIGDDSERLRLIHIDGNKKNDKLSNLKKATEDRKNKKELNLTEELKKFSKDDLLKLINSMIGA